MKAELSYKYASIVLSEQSLREIMAKCELDAEDREQIQQALEVMSLEQQREELDAR